MIERDVLSQEADTRARGRVAEGATEEASGAGGCAREAEGNVDCRCFAGAVGAQEAEDFAGFDGEREIVERGDATWPQYATAVQLGDMLELQRWGHSMSLRYPPPPWSLKAKG